MPNRLIVVADHEKAQLFRAKGRKIHELINQITNEEAGSCQPCSRREGLSQHMGGTGHFFNPHTQIKDVEKETFARHISKIVYNKMNTSSFEEIILVAEPRLLGLLRKSLKHYYTHVPVHKELSLAVTHLEMKELEDKIFA